MPNRPRATRLVRFISWPAAVALPVIFVLVQILHDHRFQRNDAGWFLQVSQDAYRAIRSQGILIGGLSSYTTRYFRPILHPYLATPFFFLASGNANLAIAWYILIAYGLFSLLTCALLAEYLTGLNLIIATWIVTLSPAIIFQTTEFRSELTLLWVFVGFLLFLKRSDFFRSKSDSALCGIFLGLSVCTRPTEGLMYGGLLIIPSFYYAVKKARLKLRDVLFFVLVTAIAGFIFRLQVLSENKLTGLCLMTSLLPVVFLGFRKRLALSETAWYFFSMAFALPILWYAPVAKGLYDWAWVSAFSDWAKLTGLRDGVSFFGFFRQIADFNSWPILVLLFVITLCRRYPLGKSWITFVLLAPAVTLPALLASLSYNGDPKNYLLSAIIVLLAALVAALGPNTKRSWVYTVLTAAIALVLLDYRLAVERADGRSAASLQQYLRGPAIPLRLGHDQVEDLYDDLSTRLPHTQADPEVQTCILQLLQWNDLDWVADPYALTVLGHERGEHWNFLRPWPLIRNTTPERYEWVKTNCDYILVLPLKHEEKAHFVHFMSDAGEAVLDAWKQNRLKKDRLELSSHGTFRGNDGTNGEYLLFHSLRNQP